MEKTNFEINDEFFLKKTWPKAFLFSMFFDLFWTSKRILESISKIGRVFLNIENIVKQKTLFGKVKKKKTFSSFLKF